MEQTSKSGSLEYFPVQPDPNLPKGENRQQPESSEAATENFELFTSAIQQDTQECLISWFNAPEILESGSSFAWYAQIRDNLEEIAERYRQSPGQAVQIFLESYIEFIEYKLTDATEQESEQVKEFILQIDSALFGMHPNLSTLLPGYLGKFQVASQALQIPELQGSLAARTIAEINYSASFDPNSSINIYNSIRDLDGELTAKPYDPSGNKKLLMVLDAIGVLESSIREGKINGNWSKDGVRRMDWVLTKLGKSEKPFIAAYANAAKQRLSTEREILSVFRYQNDARYARMNANVTQDQLDQEDELSRTFYTDIEIPAGGHMLKIGKDTLTLTDQGLIPQYIALIPDKHLAPSALPELALRYLLEGMEGKTELNENLWQGIIAYYNSQILDRLQPGISQESEQLGQEWERLCPALSASDWQAYFTTQKRLSDLRQKARETQLQRDQEAVLRNLNLTKIYIKAIVSSNDIKAQLNGDPEGWMKQAGEALQNGEIEDALSITDAIVARITRRYEYLFKEPKDLPAVSAWAKDLKRQLHDQHRLSYDLARQKTAMSLQPIEAEYLVIQQQFHQLSEKLVKNPLLSLEPLRQEIIQLHQQAKSEQTPVDFLRIKDIDVMPGLNQFGTAPPKNISALLQRLHQPDVRQYIETSIGVSLADLTLQSQIYLLDFMSKLNHQSFEKLQTVLAGYPGNKPKFLESFLALQMGDEFGESLITIAEASANGQLEQAEVEQLFQHIEQIRQTGEKVGQFFAASDEQTARSVHHAIVRRTTEILAVAESLAKGVAPHATLFQEDQIVQTNSLAEVNQALAIFSQALTQAATAFQEAPSEILSDENERLGVGYQNNTTVVQLRWTPRTFGEHNSEVEFDGEPRVNILVNLDHQPMTEQRSDPARSKAFSLRLDWESRVFQENGEPLIGEDGLGVFDVHRPHATVSLDIGGLIPDDTDPNWKVGKQCAIGNTLRSAKQGRHKMLNHVREVFAYELGDQKTFIQMVLNLRNHLLAQIPQSSPAPDRTPRPVRPAA